MLLLFVAGIMNLLWIALIAAVVLIEKMLPPSRALNYGLAGVSVAAGTALAIEGFVRGQVFLKKRRYPTRGQSSASKLPYARRPALRSPDVA
jgi:hypothetical protein